MYKTLTVFIIFIMSFTFLPAQNNEYKIKRPLQHLKDTRFETKQLATNSEQSIPLGNGDIGVNVWVEKNGDLLFYISKSDAWGQNMETLKIGKVRIHIESMPFVPGQTQQILTAHEGLYKVIADKKDGKKCEVLLWVDAKNPQVIVEVDSESDEYLVVTSEIMRTQNETIEKGISPWMASKANIAYAMQTPEQKSLPEDSEF
jgi:hypothetical protein